jgi:hypothetical protein
MVWLRGLWTRLSFIELEAVLSPDSEFSNSLTFANSQRHSTSYETSVRALQFVSAGKQAVSLVSFSLFGAHTNTLAQQMQTAKQDTQAPHRHSKPA